MISAFGIEHGAPISKKDKNASGAALAAGGGTVAAVGLAGGGVPGVKSTRLLHDVKEASGRKSKAATLGRAYKGGEFGYRHNAHHTFKTFGLGGDGPGVGSSLQAKHDFAVRTGKVGAEDTIIRHLKIGRRASNVALVGGAGVAAYGVNRAKSKVAKSERSDRANGALVGGGLATAGLAHGGRKLMHHEGDKWSERARADLLAANKTAPKIIKPGTTPYAAKEAGALRGAAVQGKYFGAVYHKFGTYTGKGRNPALAAAAVGAGGLALTRKKKPVAKSAFGIDHVSKSAEAWDSWQGVARTRKQSRKTSDAQAGITGAQRRAMNRDAKVRSVAQQASASTPTAPKGRRLRMVRNVGSKVVHADVATKLAGAKVPKKGKFAVLIPAAAGVGYASGKVNKREHSKSGEYARSAAVGSVGAGAVYTAGGAAVSQSVNRLQPRAMTRRDEKVVNAHRKAYGLATGKDFVASSGRTKEAYFRSYPKGVPYSGTRRLLARTHGAAGGGRKQGTVLALGAVGGLGYEAAKNRKKAQP